MSQLLYFLKFLHTIAYFQVESTASCIRCLRSGDASDLVVMGNVEIVAAVRAARGCTAASSYKFEVLLSWDMDSADLSSSANVSSVTGAEQQMSCDGVDSKVAVKQVEVSNGFMLHEVLALLACCFCCVC
jgi:hypothetical protein